MKSALNLLIVILSLLSPSLAGAVGVKMTGVDRIAYRCTRLMTLNNPASNFNKGQFEESVSWQNFTRNFDPAEFELNVAIGRMLDLHMSAHFQMNREDQAVRIKLDPHTYHPTTASLIEAETIKEPKKKLSKSERALVRMSYAFHLFAPKKWQRAKLARSIDDPDWAVFFANDFSVYASAGRDYAIILADSLEWMSVCLPYPGNGATPKLKAKEVRNAAFRFLSKFNELYADKCEKALKPKN